MTSLADRLERALLVLVGATVLGPLLPVLAALPLVLAGSLVPDGPDSHSVVRLLPTGLGLWQAVIVQGGGLAAVLLGLGVAGLVVWRGNASSRAIFWLGLMAGSLGGLAPLWPQLLAGAQLAKKQFALPLAFLCLACVTAKVLEHLARRVDILPPTG